MSNITVNESIDKQKWEDFLLSIDNPPFLQSWNMKKLHQELDEQTLHIAIYDQDKLVGIALVINVHAKRGRYLYLPYGPIFKTWKTEYLNALTTYLITKAKELKIDFLRSSPFIEDIDANRKMYAQIGWKRSPIHMLAEYIWWLNIDNSEDQILKEMRKTMRNLIKRAKRDGVTIECSKKIEDVDTFIQIHKDTVVRHGFVPYTDAYFRSQVKAFLDDDQVLILLAKYQGKVISAAIIMFYGNMASYHHGASLSEYRKIPASYLLQWQAILEAKKRGITKYNFWGIVPESKLISPVLKRKHPFSGVTTFKTGFGGDAYNLLPCQDYKITSKYYFTKLIETVRRIKRGFW